MGLREMERQATEVSSRAEIALSLQGTPAADPLSAAALWNYLLRKCGAAAPSVLFLGGGLDTSYLAMFHRALVPGDFVRLWTSCESHGEGRP